MTPDELAAFYQRQQAAEPQVQQSFAQWVRGLHGSMTLTQVLEALRTGVSELLERYMLAAAPLRIDLKAFAGGEAQQALEQAERDVGRFVFAGSFNVRDPKFELAVEQAGAHAIHEVTQETREAVRQMVATAYRSGWHPYDFAPQVASAVGLTQRQSGAVLNLYQGQREAGAEDAVASKRAQAYAGKLLRERGKTIALTETLRAANVSRVMGFRQAADHGLFDRTRAYLEWLTAPEDGRVCPQCEALSGDRVPLDQGFDEGPPLHPRCRCIALLRIE